MYKTYSPPSISSLLSLSPCVTWRYFVAGNIYKIWYSHKAQSFNSPSHLSNPCCQNGEHPWERICSTWVRWSISHPRSSVLGSYYQDISSGNILLSLPLSYHPITYIQAAPRIYHPDSHRLLIPYLRGFHFLGLASRLRIQFLRLLLDCTVHYLCMFTPPTWAQDGHLLCKKIFVTPLFFPKFYLYWVHLFVTLPNLTNFVYFADE